MAVLAERPMEVTVGGEICIIQAVSTTQVDIITPAITGTNLDIKISFNNALLFDNSLSLISNVPTITTLSPDHVNPVITRKLTIAGSNFESDKSLFTINIVNQDTQTASKIRICEILEATSTQITCAFLGAPIGDYWVYLDIFSTGYSNKMALNV